MMIDSIDVCYQRITELEKGIDEYRHLSTHIGTIEDINKLFQAHDSLSKENERLQRDVDYFKKFILNDPSESETIYCRIDNYQSHIDRIFSDSSIYLYGFLHSTTEELEKRLIKSNQMIEETEKTLKNTQGIQLTMFSIVVSILAVILSNVKILSDSAIAIKSILQVNISFLISIDVLFTLIYFYIGSIDNQKKSWLKSLILLLFPVILILLLIWIAKNM